jgi:hypothetical protein
MGGPLPQIADQRMEKPFSNSYITPAAFAQSAAVTHRVY